MSHQTDNPSREQLATVAPLRQEILKVEADQMRAWLAKGAELLGQPMLASAAHIIERLQLGVCDGCGTSWTAEDIAAGGHLSCCPERKMLTAEAWRERALQAEAAQDALCNRMEALEGRPAAKAFREMEAELQNKERSFDLRWRADMRAIKRWQAAGPGRELTWPDHADLCVWLLGELDQAQQREESQARTLAIVLQIMEATRNRLQTVIDAQANDPNAPAAHAIVILEEQSNG